MHESRLIQILSIFTSEEMVNLEKFIQSPLFNDGKRPLKVQLLLSYLLPYHPDFQHAGIEKERIFSELFPDEPFNSGKLAKLSSELVQVVRKFIVIRQEGPFSEYNFWLKQVQFFRERQLDSEFHYAGKKMQKLLDESVFREMPFFYRQFSFEIERTKFQVRINDKKGDANLPAVIQSLDIFYILAKLEFCAYILSQGINIHLDATAATKLLDEVLQMARIHYDDIPLVAAYCHIFPLLMNPVDEAEADFQALKKILQRHPGRISKAELKTIHNYMRNYLANRYNHGYADSLSELFALFKEQTDLQTIYQDDFHILASTLQNAITVALKLGETDWAFDFLIKHETRIHGADDAQSVFEFNLANIFFHQGNYEKADECLKKYHFRDLFYNLAVRRLELKIQYETHLLLDIFESRLKSFKSFIHEHKPILLADKFESNNNFIKILLQIFTLLRKIEAGKSQYREETQDLPVVIRKLITRLGKMKIVAEREWLEAKLIRLLPRR